MESIIAWEKLDTIPSIANGPKLSELTVNMPWSGFLKLLIEICLIGLDKDPEKYVDSDISYENKKRKNVKVAKMLVKQNNEKVDSDDDFVEQNKKKSKLNIEKRGKTLVKTLKGSVIQSVIVAATQHAPRQVLQPDTVQQQAIPMVQTENRCSVILTQKHAMQSSVNIDTDTHDKSDTENSSDDEVEPITPPTKYNKHVTRSKQLEELGLKDQEKTPERRNSLKLRSPRPTSKCFSNWKGDDRNLTLSDYKPRCLVQVIAINSTTRHAPCNIRISDGRYWIDSIVENNLRIHFLNNLVVENDILEIMKTTGNLHDGDFKILAFVRPQWAQNGGVREGNPVPLMENTIVSARRIVNLNIVPLVSSCGSFDSDDFDGSVLENPAKTNIIEKVFDDTMNQKADEDENGDSNTNNEEIEIDETGNPNLIFSKDVSLSQMLNSTQRAPTLADTPLGKLKLTEDEILKMSISKNVFNNAVHLKSVKFDTGEPIFDGLSANWTIESEFQDLKYQVRIEWPNLMPRTARSWSRTYPSSCTCPGYTQHGPARLCKHIDLVLLKYFTS